MVIITVKRQTFHNFPSKQNEFEGSFVAKYIVIFEESVVCDAPKRKHPSANKNCSQFKMFFPGLPKEAHCYHPAVSKTGGFDDHSYVVDSGRNWTTFHVDSKLRCYVGSANNVTVIDEYIVIN